MSAIFGLIHLDKKPVDAEELGCMGAALAIYGMEGGRQWREGAVGLGQRLLQATPQDAFEQQPLTSAEGQLCLVSDGRIDNRPELIETLKIGVPATELADGAIILRAYERWESECVHHLIGTFTFALWDARLHQLLVVRSPLASPSLFIHATPHTLAFATMPKGLFALPFIARKMDEQYLADYLARAGTEPTATFYINVTRLLPGQKLVVQTEKPGEKWSVETDWQPDLTRKIHFARDEEYVEAFNALFTRVVHDHLRSQSQAGVMMSGGLDSTAVAAVAARLYQQGHRDDTGKRLATFTEVPRASFDGAIIGGRYADETPYAQAMARHYPNLDLNLIQSGSQIYTDDIDSLFAAAETPFPNASNRVWYEAILRAAQAQGVRHLLTGSGGNLTMSWRGEGLLPQLVGAGHWAKAWQEARALTPRGNHQATLKSLFMAGILPHTPDWFYVAFERLRTLGRNEADSMVDWRKLSPIRPDFAIAHHVDERARARQSHLRSRASVNMQGSRWHSLLSGIRRSDGLGAGYQALYGVTLCDPTSDLRLVEFCLALPEAQYQRNGETRWLIRRAMANQLPAEVLNNKARGLQAAGWYENLYRARGRLLDELARIEACDLARRSIDLPRLRNMVEGMQAETANANRQMAIYRGILERGLMTGSFIRWVEGGK
jgi:asparagine synthase (glutamine-hydrolysing)